MPSTDEMDTWLLTVDNPSWGNNAEASSSTGPRMPRLQLIRARSSLYSAEDSSCSNGIMEHVSEGLTSVASLNDSDSPNPVASMELVEYSHEFVVSQIMRKLHPSENIVSLPREMEELIGIVEMENDDSRPIPDIEEDVPEASPYGTRKKRKAKAKTPLVDDEVRRSSRFRKGGTDKHIMLDREPRRKNGEAKKTISFSVVEDLKKAIISRSLDTNMEEADMVEPGHKLGTSFCGVPPEELTLATLEPNEE